MQLFDIRQVRIDFPFLEQSINEHPPIYLDTASTSQKPTGVIETVSQFYREEYATVHRAVYALAVQSTERYEEVRSKVKRFIHAPEEGEIVFTRGTTEAINLVAHSYANSFLKPGDEIILTDMEHHSNMVPWQLVAQKKEIKLNYIPFSLDGDLQLDVFKSLLSEKTKLVSVTHLSNVIGTINPIREIIALAHNLGAKVFIDGAQAASHLPLDMQAYDADFYAFSGHKMYGPTGIGILYAKRALLEQMPPFIAGGDMIESVTKAFVSFQPPPLKFEAGTPSIASVIGLGAAIDYIERIGKRAIQDWEQTLVTFAQQKLSLIDGVTLIGNPRERGPILSFLIKGVHPLDLGALLDLRGIAIRTGHLCAQPTLKRFHVSSLARLSFGIYTTLEEIEEAICAIDEIASHLRGTKKSLI